MAKRATQTGTYRLEVRAYAGSGEYVVDVSAGLGAGADQPPSVAIADPAEGATVSGSVTVKVQAADDVAVSKVELSVDGGPFADITGNRDGADYTWAWDTTRLPNGSHTLTARATDTAGQRREASVAVTVANQAPDRVFELRKSGRVSAAARDARFAINVHAAGYVDLTLAWQGKADLDFYVYGPDGTQLGRAYTLSNPERLRVDTLRLGPGTYQVRVNLYAGPETDFTLTATGYQQVELTGTVSPSAKDATHQRPMAYPGRGLATLSWSGSSDLDCYLLDPTGRERGKAFTLKNPEVLETPIDATGTWAVRVNLYAGNGGSYSLKWTVPEAVLS